MNDDFRGDINTRGRYRIADAPLLISSDFLRDEDWIRVDGLKRFYGHRFFVYHAIDDPLPGVSGVNSEIYNLSGERTGNSLSLNRTGTFTPLDGATSVFLASSSSPANGSQGNFRVFARFEDLVSNTGSESLRPNAGYSRASAIETSGDVDAFRFEFQAGRTYYMSLRGVASNSTHLTTLGDPILRLFNSQGNFIKGDNNSGKGTDASLIYTPTEDQSLVLRVYGANGSTGSYRLESRQFDDYLNTSRTAGLFFPNQAPVTTRSDFHRDVDWLRFRLQKGYTYSVTGGSLRAPEGEEPISGQFGRYQTKTAGDHFVVATQSGQAEVKLVDDYLNTFSFGIGSIAPLAVGAIETVGDRDRFRVNVFPFQDYKFELVANGEFTLGRSFFNLREGQGDIVKSGSTQINHQIEDTTLLTRQTAYLTVGGIANGTGTYQISATLINDVAGDKTTQSSFEFANDAINIKGAIATDGDVDFHRVSLKAKTWYRFTKQGVNTLKVISPTDTNTFVGSAVNPQSRAWYYALEDGDHFIEFLSGRLSDGRSTGSYTLEIENGYQPETYSNVFAWPNPAPNGFTGDPGTIDDASRQFRRNVEVYSNIDMEYQDGQNTRVLPARELKILSFEQWKTTVPVVDENLGGVGELFVRSIRASGFKSRWSNVLLSKRPVPTAITTETKNETLTYAFADGLPSYLEGNSDYASFQPLTDNEREVIQTAYDRWNFGIFQENVEPGEGNDEGFAMIYKAALSTSDPVVSFQPGAGIGADIVLNTNSPVINDLSLGSESFFELLRGIGVTLGLKETDEVGRDQSVMGLRTGGSVDSLPFASSPLALDYRAASRNPEFGSVGPFARSRFYLGGDPFYDSINRLAYNFPPIDNSISAEGSTLRSIIDLRPGMTSYSRSGSEQPYTFVNAYHAPIENGIGSETNDFLFGNERRNILQGRGGNDVLIGGIATDNLLGGAGNDIYIYRPGYGDDIIDEQALGGAEVLRIEGMHNMDSLSDVSFQRLGADLLIRLEMDGRGDRDGDSIRIKNMANAESRVEALTLLNPSGPVTRISLVSAFNQLGTSIETFRVTAARDSHGQIVTPI